MWGAIAGAFGEGMMHPVDTIKTRMQSEAIIDGIQVKRELVNILDITVIGCSNTDVDILSLVNLVTKAT